MKRASDPELLVLHAVRVRGWADGAAVAGRYGLDPAEADEILLDHQAHGWIAWSEFLGSGGWSLTASGRAEDERRLAAELLEAGPAGAVVRGVVEVFGPLNDRLQRACTRWQLRPAPGDLLAVNDHADPAWDAEILAELAELSDALAPLVVRLAAVLDRFGGYDTRFAAALGRASRGEGAWVAGTGLDSCHTVWMELHEDLLATLGIARG